SLVVALCWLAGAGIAIARTTRAPGAKVRRVAAFLAVHAIGALPLALVTARPEPVMTAALLAYVAFPLAWSIPTRRTPLGRALVTIGFFLVTSVFTFAHSKALLFAPFVVLSALLTFSWRRPAWLVLGLALVTAT